MVVLCSLLTLNSQLPVQWPLLCFGPDTRSLCHHTPSCLRAPPICVQQAPPPALRLKELDDRIAELSAKERAVKGRGAAAKREQLRSEIVELEREKEAVVQVSARAMRSRVRTCACFAPAEAWSLHTAAARTVLVTSRETLVYHACNSHAHHHS